MPGSFKSSTNDPVPVMSRGSSRRLIPLPKSVAIFAPPPSGRGRGRGRGLAHGGGRGADRLDDVLVAGAAAEGALQGVADLLLVRRGVGRQEIRGAHDDPRGAEPALETVLLPERLLERMQCARRSESLDGRYLVPVGLHREHGTALDRFPIEVHGTRAALAGVAADVRAGEVEVIAKNMNQEAAGLDLDRVAPAIDGEGDGAHHRAGSLLPQRKAVAGGGEAGRSFPRGGERRRATSRGGGGRGGGVGGGAGRGVEPREGVNGRAKGRGEKRPRRQR